MAINIKFDLLGNPEPPTIVLANRNGNKLGQLFINEESIELVEKFNEASEISFTVNKYINGEIVHLWDKIVDFKLIYCKEWDTWFEIKVELDEASESVKTVFGTQLGQAELSQTMLYNVEINTEKDIARDDYEVGSGVFYDPLNSQCILSRVLEKAPHYSISTVDYSLYDIQRSFSFDGISIYDALQEIAEEIGCFFEFISDSDENGNPRRKIAVHDLQQNCRACGYRGEAKDICPNIDCPTNKNYDLPNQGLVDGYGDDTSIFVTADELASNGIQLVTDADSVKNCFKLEAGDDLMTATIRNRNPNGTDYIWYFSEATKEDMPDDLVKKIEEYDEEYEDYYNTHRIDLDKDLVSDYNESIIDKYRVFNKDLNEIGYHPEGFSSLMKIYYDVIDLEWYLKSGLMPEVTTSETTAQDEADFLDITFVPIVAVHNLNTVSLSTANSAVLAMAKTCVNSSYKVEIDSSTLISNNKWQGRFQITSYANEEDTALSAILTITLSDNEELYIEQQLDKVLNREDTEDLSISGVFEKEILFDEWNGKYFGEFVLELEKYALAPLNSFHDACQACLDILIEQGVGKDNSKPNPWDSDSYDITDTNNELYEKLYVPYYNKLMALEEEIALREDEINIVVSLKEDIEKHKADIQDHLNFENYLGNELWWDFCAYRREDKYSNPNYTSEGLNNVQLFDRASQFYEVAENEIFKSAELQHSISATLNNLLAIPKFKPLIDSFNVGNWIRVQVDDKIYKLRLIEYRINYKDFNNISVEFSDVSKTKNGYSDLEDILSNASSMASSYDGIKRQANLGNEARDMVRKWLNEGLDASLVQIQNNTNEDIVIDNNGLLGRSYSDITEQYSPEQIKLTHNIIAFTDDNWKSVKQAIGKHKYKYYDKGKKDFVDNIGYGLSADFVTAGVVSGSQIIGGDVYSDNYSEANKKGSYINLRDGNFSFGDGRITFNGTELKISSPDILSKDEVTQITNDTLSTTNVYAKNLQVNAGKIQDLQSVNILASQITSGQITSDHIDLKGMTVYNSAGDVSFAISSTGEVTINGDVTMSNSSTITWEDIMGATDEDGISAEEYIYGAYDSADDAKSNAQLAYDNAVALANGGTLYDSAGDPITSTFISGKEIRSPLIKAHQFDVYPEDDYSGNGAFNLYGRYDDKLYNFFQLSYHQELAPNVNISSPNKAKINISASLNIDGIISFESGSQVDFNVVDKVSFYNVDEITFTHSKVDFTNATVTGLDDTINNVMSDTITNIEDNAIDAAVDAAYEAVDEALSDFTVSEITKSTASLYIGTVSTNGYHVISNRSIVPSSNHTQYVGTSYRAWSGLYAESGAITTSDLNRKNSIEELPKKYIDMMDIITPKRFKLNDGTSGRYHVGFIAQDVERAMINSGIDSTEFGGWVKDVDEDGNDIYMLRYDEFGAIYAAKIKQLESRIVQLEFQLSQLENK